MRQSREAALQASLPPLLLTRPADASGRFAELWRAKAGAKAAIVIAPVVAIDPVPHDLMPGVAIFTSARAVPQIGPGGRAFCVGARTAEAARVAGYVAESAGGTADDLIAAILASGDAGPFVHYRGREARGEVAAQLAVAGRVCAEVITYAQRTLPLSAEALALLTQAGKVLLPLFSPRSAERLAEALEGREVKAELLLVAMSPAVAQAWRGPAPARMMISDQPSAEAMCDTLLAITQAP